LIWQSIVVKAGCIAFQCRL